MRPSTVLVVHPEALVAEAITAALASFPGVLPVRPATSATDAEARTDRDRVDAVAVDERLAAAGDLPARLRRRGARVVVIGGEFRDDEDGVRVPTGGSVRALATALVPSLEPSRSRPLSARQERVLSLVAHGMTAKEVAGQLGISRKTVEQHKARIYERLGVRTQAAAVRAAFDPSRGPMMWGGS